MHNSAFIIGVLLTAACGIVAIVQTSGASAEARALQVQLQVAVDSLAATRRLSVASLALSPPSSVQRSPSPPRSMPRRVSVSQPDVNLSLQSTVVTLEERIQRLERSLEHFAVSGARDRVTTPSPSPLQQLPASSSSSTAPFLLRADEAAAAAAASRGTPPIAAVSTSHRRPSLSSSVGAAEPAPMPSLMSSTMFVAGGAPPPSAFTVPPTTATLTGDRSGHTTAYVPSMSGRRDSWSANVSSTPQLTQSSFPSPSSSSSSSSSAVDAALASAREAVERFRAFAHAAPALPPQAPRLSPQARSADQPSPKSLRGPPSVYSGHPALTLDGAAGNGTNNNSSSSHTSSHPTHSFAGGSSANGDRSLVFGAASMAWPSSTGAAAVPSGTAVSVANGGTTGGQYREWSTPLATPPPVSPPKTVSWGADYGNSSNSNNRNSTATVNGYGPTAYPTGSSSSSSGSGGVPPPYSAFMTTAVSPPSAANGHGPASHPYSSSGGDGGAPPPYPGTAFMTTAVSPPTAPPSSSSYLPSTATVAQSYRPSSPSTMYRAGSPSAVESLTNHGQALHTISRLEAVVDALRFKQPLRR